MNSSRAVKIAKEKTPQVTIKVHDNFSRYDVVSELVSNNNIGIELGVASGGYSSKMVNSGKFSSFFGVDLYSDTHDTEEYKIALKSVGITNNYNLLRMSFEDALSLFEDDYFDFIYIDGFAHTGEEGGKTLIDWLPKLKPGGILAGDDYHSDWPLVIWAINDLCVKINADLNLTGKVDGSDYSLYPSWFIRKPNQIAKKDLEVNALLYKISQSERRRINWWRVSYFSPLVVAKKIAAYFGITSQVKSISRRLKIKTRI